MGPRIKTTKKRRDLARDNDDNDNTNGDSTNNNINSSSSSSSNNINNNNNNNLSHSQSIRDHSYVDCSKAIPMPWIEPKACNIVALPNSVASSTPSDHKPSPIPRSNQPQGLNPDQKPTTGTKPKLAWNSNVGIISEPKSNSTPNVKPESAMDSDVAANLNSASFVKPVLNLKSPVSNSPTPHINASPNHMPPPNPVSQTGHKDKSFYSYKDFGSTFTWETYLKLKPAPVAPKKAFRQASEPLLNQFTIGMKLEAKDPRNSSNWCLATVIFTEGLHLRLRFMGGDDKNDLYEIIDSDNIRPVGSCPSDLLLAPTGYTGNIAFYPKYVEKVLREEATIIAPPEYFPDTPPRPEKNLFERGMKLEAIDRKNRDFICPATVADVDGDMLRISFDGWRGSFDYKCTYYSRDIFPVNWCKEVGRPIQPPHGWENVLNGGNLPSWTPPQSPSQTKSASTSPPAKKSRGRPRKESNKESGKSAKFTYNSKDTTKTTRGRPSSSNLTSPPKKQSAPVEEKPGNFRPLSESVSPQSPDDGSITGADILNDEPNIHRFQCQRTISYSEWQEMKQLEMQMPRTYSSDDVSETTDAGMTSSEATSTCPTESDSHEPNQKRVKTDTGIPLELRNILDCKPKTLTRWNVQDVVDVLKTETSLEKYLDTFHENEIDGKAFGLFDAKKRDLLMSMGLKLGPVLKVLNLREQVELYLSERQSC